MIKKFACKSSHFVWNSKINRIIRTIFRTNKTVFLPPPFFQGGVREGLSGVRRRPGTQASPPASSPLKTIKGSLKSKVLMVLYAVFNGDLERRIKSPFKGDLEGLCPGAQASPPASPPLSPLKVV